MLALASVCSEGCCWAGSRWGGDWVYVVVVDELGSVAHSNRCCPLPWLADCQAIGQGGQVNKQTLDHNVKAESGHLFAQCETTS